MRLRTGIAAIATFLLCAALPGCSGLADQPITIGALYNLTGAQMALDVPSAEGARLAVAEANRKGGVLNAPVTLVVADGQSKPAVLAKEAGQMIARYPAIAGLIGLSDTDMVGAAAPVAAKHHRVFLTSGATSPHLPESVPGYLFLACFGDNVQAAAAAEWAFERRKARRVAVLFNRDTTYTRLLQRYFESRFKELGGTVISVQHYTLDKLTANLSALRKADLVYLAAYPDDVTTVIPYLRKGEIKAPILGGDGLDIGDAWKTLPDTRDVFFTTHAYLGADNPDPAVQHFRAAFKEAYAGRTPDAFAALGFDTARLLMAAVETAGSADPVAVQKALAATSGFKGVTGTITYRNGSRIPAKSVTIMEVDHGRQKFVANILPSKIPDP